MANCPNCGRKLRLTDWRPECPGCGANLNYYNSNKALLEESEKAEAEHARFQPKVDRAKAAYAGSKLAVARIVLSLLPVGALFLPLCKINGAGKNAIALYNAISASGTDLIFGNVLPGTGGISVLLLLLSAVFIIVSLVLILMSLGKHGKVRVIITYSLIALCAVGSAALFAASGAGSLGIGAYLYIALTLVLLGFNIYLLKKGIPVKYTECLIGGLPSDEYFRLKEQGISQSELYRKMLVALAELEEKAAENEEGGEQQ